MSPAMRNDPLNLDLGAIFEGLEFSNKIKQ